MKMTFLFRLEAWQLVLVLFAIMILSSLAGRYIGQKYLAGREKDGTMLGSLFAILGLMLAFTFSMTLTRYEKRIETVIQESNDIGTAILRADLYPEEHRQLLRADFKQYVEARIAFFEARKDIVKVFAAQRQSEAIGQQIWNRAAKLSFDPAITVPATMQMIPALNAMLDINNARMRISLNKVPESVLYLLFALIFICSFQLGYTFSEKKKMDWLGTIGVTLLICSVIYLIIDMDRPNRGTMTLEQTNQSIVDLRKMF